jgi:hypothetical protein
LPFNWKYAFPNLAGNAIIETVGCEPGWSL